MQNHSNTASERVKYFDMLIKDLVTEMFFLPPSINDLLELRYEHPPVPTSLPVPIIPSNSTRDMGSSHIDLDYPPETPEPTRDDGLTDSEFWTVAERTNNPKLDASEQADAAMMMLFGTRGK